MHPSLGLFHPVIGRWFSDTFGVPTPPQEQGWPRIAAGANVLLLAPTGSGKTLAAFLACIDWLYQHRDQQNHPEPGVKILYVSPLKALNNDIHINLQQPLAGLDRTAAALGMAVPSITAAVRTGDTPANERQRMVRRPPDILITTPESLFLMLSSKAREVLRTVQFVIVDEIHTLFPEKRGAHLAVSLERLQNLGGGSLQRIGLSATMRPLEEIGKFLVGPGRSLEILDTGSRRNYDLALALPTKDYRRLPEQSIWPEIYKTLYQLVLDHTTTLVFVNNRRLAERLTAQLNRLADKEIARTHHGSISKEMRLSSEEMLKQGKIPCIVATSSLELGIDVGHIDLVVQIESPKETARGMQRVGRAGHVQHLPSKGRLIPKTLIDLLECTVVMAAMRRADVEESRAPRGCLDILAQQLVAMTTEKDWRPQDMYQLVKGSYTFAELAWEDFENVLAMLAGIYQSDAYVELKPRLYWDRVHDQVRSDAYGVRLVYSNGGTIPQRGYFGVYLAGQNLRLGELDEEFIYERRLGERFVLGTTVWRIEEMRQDRVVVTRAKDQGANVPFWKGEALSRSFALGQEIGRFLREAEPQLDAEFATWLKDEWELDNADAAANLGGFLQRQRRAVGQLPHDRQWIFEEFLDEAGQWHVLLHCFCGRKINMLLGLLLQEQLQQEQGLTIEAVASDNGILFHAPGGTEPPLLDLGQLDRLNTPRRAAELLRTTSIFGTLFRHNAQRSLVLSLRGFGQKRTPLWLSRLKASDLLQIVQEFPGFPLVKETYRELLQDYFSLAELDHILERLQSGAISVKRVQLAAPSPFAHAHLFEFVGTQMYGDDTPKRRSSQQQLQDNPQILQELLGNDTLALQWDEQILHAVLDRLQGRAAFIQEPSQERAQYWLEQVGDFYGEEIPSILQEYATVCLEQGILRQLSVGQKELWVAVVYGEFFTASSAKALAQHYLRCRGPVTAQALAARYDRPCTEMEQALSELVTGGQVAILSCQDEQNDRVQYVATRVLQEVQRRVKSQARREIDVKQSWEFTEFLRDWQSASSPEPEQRLEAMAAILQKLAYVWLPVQHLDTAIFPLRLIGYQRSDLDAVLTSGLFCWRAQTRGRQWWVRFEPAMPALQEQQMPDWIPNPHWQTTYSAQRLSEQGQKVLHCLERRGALGLPQLSQELGVGMTSLFPALEELMAAGLVSNDSLGPLRFLAQFSAAQKRDPRLLVQPKLLTQMGRFFLMNSVVEDSGSALVQRMLDQFGVVSREMVPADTLRWGDLYPILDYWETIGSLRRGYFVSGLSGVQFARPEALSSLQEKLASADFWTAVREDPLHVSGLHSLSAGMLVYSAGRPLWSLSRSQLQLLVPEETQEQLALALRHLVQAQYESDLDGKIRIRTLGGQNITETEWAKTLLQWGFEPGYEEMVLWPSQRF